MAERPQEHRPQFWYWEADSDNCPHGPEPEDDTTEAWEEWTDCHPWSPQDVRICLDAPVGKACRDCSDGEFVPWSACTEPSTSAA